MGRLIIVAGASGAGKSFFLENATGLFPHIKIIKKLSTRKARSFEEEGKGDLIFNCTKSQISSCKYRYFYSTTSSKHFYGISKQEIDNALKGGKNPIVIVRCCTAIKLLKEDYPLSLVIYLQSILSGQDLQKKLVELGRTDIDLQERVARNKQDLDDYLTHFRDNIFDEVVINNYEEKGLISQLQEIACRKLKDTVERRQVFVIMSFRRELDNIFEAISQASRSLDEIGIRLKVIRIDKQMGDYKITEKIIEYIEKSELIVCDLTDERPNVYWELGYARGVNKKVISVAKYDTELHFDIKDFNTVFYKDAFDLMKKLSTEFKAFYSGEVL